VRRVDTTLHHFDGKKVSYKFKPGEGHLYKQKHGVKDVKRESDRVVVIVSRGACFE